MSYEWRGGGGSTSSEPEVEGDEERRGVLGVNGMAHQIDNEGYLRHSLPEAARRVPFPSADEERRLAVSPLHPFVSCEAEERRLTLPLATHGSTEKRTSPAIQVPLKDRACNQAGENQLTWVVFI